MTETVVRVSTIEEWKSVLDVWFEQGYKWYSGDKEYYGEYFKAGSRELLLNKDNDILVPTPGKREQISYKEFMAQQKEGNKMETYYVTREQYDLIRELKSKMFPIDFLIINTDGYFEPLTRELSFDEASSLLRYLGGDKTVTFKVKEQLQRLWRINDADNKVYMRFNLGTPDWTLYEERAFTAPLEEVKKWKTPAWNIEEVK